MNFDYRDGPTIVIGARNWITPPAELVEAFFPIKEWIIDAIHDCILSLPGHRVTMKQKTSEFLRRKRLGV
jgi:2-oxoisovalerate dehydrogenase E1 component